MYIQKAAPLGALTAARLGNPISSPAHTGVAARSLEESLDLSQRGVGEDIAAIFGSFIDSFRRDEFESRGLGDDLKNAAESVVTSKVTGAVFDGIADLFEREDFDLTDRGVGTDIKNVAEGVASSEAGDLIFDGILALFVRGELGNAPTGSLRARGSSGSIFDLD